MDAMDNPSFGDLLRRYRKGAGLSQDALAERAGLSARVVSDWERGIIRTPHRDTVILLAKALGLEEEDRARLEGAIERRRGPRDSPRSIPVRRAESEGAEHPPSPGDAPSPSGVATTGAQERRLLPAALVAVILALLVAALSLVVATLLGATNRAVSPTDRQPSGATSNPRIVPGGEWMSPTNGQRFTGSMRFAAHAYPTSEGDPPIARVIFTVSWPGRPGRWLIACAASKPSHGDLYRCLWNPGRQWGTIPAGRLNISFDVYDQAGNHNNAPNGVHAIYYAPHRAHH